MKIKKFDKPACKLLAGEIQFTLMKLGKKYGVEIMTGNGTYTSDTYTLKLNVSRISNGKVLSKEANDFKRYAAMHGLKAADLGRTFSSGGRTFKITGFNTKAHKYPIMGECVKSKTGFKFPVDHVKLLLDK